jgi:glycosyltransferase involved in cell wall biosynthesis
VSAPPRLSAIISFYNEEGNIPELVSRLRAVMTQLRDEGHLAGHELIFVNDASTDRSRELLEELNSGIGDLRVINMSRNFGVSTCVLAGAEYASGDVVVTIDADLQDPPETIPEMLRAYREGDNIDVVHTIRRSRAGETKIKLLITRIGYLILHNVATITIPIEAGDFKLLSRRAVNHLIQLKEKRPFLRGLVCWIGFNQAQVYYHREPRYAGRTKFVVIGPRVISNFFSSALIAFSDLPLQIASWVGALISFSSVIYSFLLAVQSMRGIPVPAWSVPVAVLSLLSGVQLFCIGLLGLYVAAIHVETKRRPNYIVESTSGFPDKVDSEKQSLADR